MLPPLILFIFIFIFRLLNLSLFGGVLFFFSYLWPITLKAPGIVERITSKKYRFSILRFIYVLDTLFRSIKVSAYPKVQWALVRSAPFFIGEAMVLVSNPNKALFPLFGVVMAETILYLRGRITNPVND